MSESDAKELAEANEALNRRLEAWGIWARSGGGHVGPSRYGNSLAKMMTYGTWLDDSPPGASADVSECAAEETDAAITKMGRLNVTWMDVILVRYMFPDKYPTRLQQARQLGLSERLFNNRMAEARAFLLGCFGGRSRKKVA